MQYKTDSNGVNYAYDPDNDVLYVLKAGVWVAQEDFASPFQVTVTGVGITPEGKSSLGLWLLMGALLIAIQK